MLGEALNKAEGKHLLYVLAAGVLGGVLLVLLDTYVLQRVETAIGVVPSAA